METIAIRELKQNPQAAIRRVLESGEPAQVTAYGKPTGAVIAPATHPGKRRWVPGSAFKDVPPLSQKVADEWQRELREGRQFEFGRDFWQDDK
jgi:antitoxin (DNA-binding transcriptional repressor) of toxin-antitoxin stability system